MYRVPQRVRDGAEGPIRSMDDYYRYYFQSMNDPDGFWLHQARSLLQWKTAPTIGRSGPPKSTWFEDGRLNASETCLDRNLMVFPEKTAILWEGLRRGDTRRLSYQDLFEAVCNFANALGRLGLVAGDKVAIYMGNVPEAAIAMLACARIGAPYCILPEDVSIENLRGSLQKWAPRFVCTQDIGFSGKKERRLKSCLDHALSAEVCVERVIVWPRGTTLDCEMSGNDLSWPEATDEEKGGCDALEVEAGYPLFYIDSPDGMLEFSCGSYLSYAAYTFRAVFDHRLDDVNACMMPISSMPGQSYLLYGPLCGGGTTLMFEGVSDVTDSDRFWETVADCKASIVLASAEAFKSFYSKDIDSACSPPPDLRIMSVVDGSVNAECSRWYAEVFGAERCAFLQTWWSDAYGGLCFAPIGPATPCKFGSAALPLPGILPQLRRGDGAILLGPGTGVLSFSYFAPGWASNISFGKLGEIRCHRDSEGYFWMNEPPSA